MWNLNFWISALVWTLILWKLEVTSAENTTVIEGIEFGEMNTVVKTEDFVYHIEVDIKNPDQLIFAVGSALKTLTGKEIRPIVGEATYSGYEDGIGIAAEFRSITGFTQLSTSAILAVDNGNNCLRLVDRLTLRTSLFAGFCSALPANAGFRDGKSPLFNHPRSVVQYLSSSNIVLVSDQKNNAIRHITYTGYSIETRTLLFFSSGSISPSGMAFDTKGDLIISNQHFIRKHSIHPYSTMPAQSEVVGSTANGFKDGAFCDALFNSPQGVTALSSNVTLIADEDSNSLRILNESSGSVSSICYKPAGDAELTCKLNKPQSVLVKNDGKKYSGEIYVGDQSSIKVISYKFSRPANDSSS